MARGCPVPDTKAKVDSIDLFNRGVCPTRIRGSQFFVGSSVPLNIKYDVSSFSYYMFNNSPAWIKDCLSSQGVLLLGLGATDWFGTGQPRATQQPQLQAPAATPAQDESGQTP